MADECSTRDRLLGITATVFVPTFVVLGLFSMDEQLLLSSLVMVTFLMAIVHYPLWPGRWVGRVIDWVMALATVYGCAYYYVQYEDLLYGAVGGTLPTSATVAALGLLLVSLEVSRRAVGPPLLLIAVALGAYAYLSSPIIAGSRLVGESFLSGNGIFGMVTSVLGTYILPFLIYGSLLQLSGGTEFLARVAAALSARSAGGAAKVACVSSALVGTIVGAGAANAAMTGAFTIPMMKRSGYTPEQAATNETVASVGGELLPPIMGSAAFLLAAAVGVPYHRVALISLLPGLLYYISQFTALHFQGARDRIGYVQTDEDITSLIKSHGHLLLSPIILVVVLFMGRSPFHAALMGICSIVVLSWLRPRQALGPKQLSAAFKEALIVFLPIGGLIGGIALILNALDLSGVPVAVSTWAFTIGPSGLPYVITVTAILGALLGAGLPVVAAYMIAATVVAPAFKVLGVPLLIAHLVALWFAQTAPVIPPFALTAAVAAAMAKARFYKTVVMSAVMARALWIVPVLILYTPIVYGALEGDWIAAVVSFLVCSLGFTALSAAIEGFIRSRLSWLEHAAMVITALLLFTPIVAAQVAGIVIGSVVLFRDAAKRRQIA